MKLGAVIIENRFSISNVIKRHEKFLPRNCKIKTFHFEHIKTASDYNNQLTNLKFWEECPYDKVLIFQHDSGLLRTGIEEFYEYDFIGAALHHIDFPCMNGGLSLRSPKAMIACIKDMPFDQYKHGNEDIYFCKQLQKLGFNLPTKEVAQKFSVETIYGLGSLGYHAISKYLTPQQCETILNQYK